MIDILRCCIARVKRVQGRRRYVPHDTIERNKLLGSEQGAGES